MIHEAKIEFCVVAVHATGERFCMAKFMYEEDAVAWMESRPHEEWRSWELCVKKGNTYEDRGNG